MNLAVSCCFKFVGLYVAARCRGGPKNRQLVANMHESMRRQIC